MLQITWKQGSNIVYPITWEGGKLQFRAPSHLRDYFLWSMNAVVLQTPDKNLEHPCNLGKMGWTPDYSLHPIQWNFSGMEGVKLLLASVRLKGIQIMQIRHLEHSDTSLIENQRWTTPQ